MYKLFLCLRFLRSRIIAYFAMIAVALCVAMMLIVISVMNGFLHKIESAAKGLFGDIIVDTGSLNGIANYDQLIDDVRKLPEIDDASPFIITGGILQAPGFSSRQLVQIAGIRLPKVLPPTTATTQATQPDQAASLVDLSSYPSTYPRISDFARGLYFQQTPTPTFDPDVSVLLQGLKTAQKETAQAISDLRGEIGELTQANTKPVPADKERMLKRLRTSLSLQESQEWPLRNAQRYQSTMRKLDQRIKQAATRPANDAEIDKLNEEMQQLASDSSLLPPDFRAILGVGLYSYRTDKGKLIRQMLPGNEISLTLIPMGQSGITAMDLKPVREQFMVVDDCRTDVSSIDYNIVYVPFETLQRLNNMDAREIDMGPDYKGPRKYTPARCSQIQIKVKGSAKMGEQELSRIRQKVEEVYFQFRAKYPDSLDPRSDDVRTWRQRQEQLVGQIASQRTLVVIMFGIISMVSVVLIFVIFYNIVFQKTKDIGVIKSVGGSSSGVAGIFLFYGAAIGLIGSIFGMLGGYFFVRNINPIHDWVGKTFGLVVWNREWFMFDQIPSEVEPLMGGLIVIGAILAGLVGAMVPAIRAARMQPVEALRYE